MNTFAPWPHFAPDEIEAAKKVLESGKVNYWTGNENKLFENEFANYVGKKHAIALANGTLALELALYALDIGPGDEVIVSARTFIASASCVIARSATPVVADIDIATQNITAETIKPRISPKTKAIIVVHLAGWPCDMDPILELAKKFDLKVIEDCAQAHGAKYKEKKVGSFGDASAFSFCQDKIMTTGGEGGMFLTDDETLWKKAWSYKDHGKNYDKVFSKNPSSSFKLVHDSFGTNWRMTEMQAAIGRCQLRKLDKWVEKRRKNAAVLEDYFRKIPALRITETPCSEYHSYYKYHVFIKPDQLKEGWTRDRIISEINKKDIPCFSGGCPEIYREKAFINLELTPTHPFPVAQELGETSLMFLVHPTLTTENMKMVCSVVTDVFEKAS